MIHKRKRSRELLKASGVSLPTTLPSIKERMDEAPEAHAGHTPPSGTPKKGSSTDPAHQNSPPQHAATPSLLSPGPTSSPASKNFSKLPEHLKILLKVWGEDLMVA
jgi:hypothetical protein